MAKRKTQIIKVVTTRSIAKEMARYDGATISSETIAVDKSEEINALAKRLEARGCPFTPEELERHADGINTYTFVITCPYQATIARWASFGVRVQVLS